MDEDADKGLKILYDMLVQAAEYPGSNECSPRHLHMWIGHLESLHAVMLQFYTPEIGERYRKAREDMESISTGKLGEQELLDGYRMGFDLLSAISGAFASEGLLIENPLGLRIVYDLFVHAGNFLRLTPLNPSSILLLHFRVRALHSILEVYMGEQHLRECRIIERQLREISKLFPAEEYVLRSREWLLNWIGLIARLLQEKNLLVAVELSFSDRIGKKR